MSSSVHTFGVCIYLNARYTYTDVCGLNHTDIVGAVANGKQNGFLIFFDQFDNKCLLQWRYTTWLLIIRWWKKKGS